MSREIKDMKIKRLTSKVTDLEAKLAESESKRKILEEKVKWLSEENEECFVDGQKYNELREQKDKEIQELKQQLAEKTLTIEQINKAFIENRSLWKGKYEQFNQDKISFAVKQLEKVKELMRSIDMPNKPELYNNDMFGAGFDSHYIRVEELIDNQINELKGKV